MSTVFSYFLFCLCVCYVCARVCVRYYCTCKAGARTAVSCAHVASILWYLGYARH